MPILSRLLPCALAAALLGACATTESEGPLRKETVFAVNDAAELLKVNAGQPRRVLDRKPVLGLTPGDRLVGLDFRVARGVLYALSASGRLYTLDTGSGKLSPVGSGAPVSLAAPGATPGSVATVGFNFNPAADRIRVVSDQGLNLRLHPDTGAVAATDPAPAYSVGDVRAGQAARLVAAAYTYNKSNDKLTTNYAIDRAAGTLVLQGSKEGVQPVVSPNTGQLSTVGALGTGPVEAAAFDISDLGNQALAALRQAGRTRLYTLDLGSGHATLLGTVADGRPLWGLAIEP